MPERHSHTRCVLLAWVTKIRSKEFVSGTFETVSWTVSREYLQRVCFHESSPFNNPGLIRANSWIHCFSALPTTLTSSFKPHLIIIQIIILSNSGKITVNFRRISSGFWRHTWTILKGGSRDKRLKAEGEANHSPSQNAATQAVRNLIAKR